MKYLFILLFCSLNIYGADKVYVKNNLYWMSYNLQFNLDKSLIINTLFQSRRLLPDKPNHTIYSVNIIKRFPNKWSISGGMTYFRLHLPQDLNSPVEIIPQEFRPYQYISLSNDVVGNLKFTNRILIEERFFQDIENGVLTNNYNFSLRLRLLGGFSIDFLKIHSDINNFGFYISNEILVHYGDRIVHNTFDQNRFQTGFSYKHNKNVLFKIGYLHWLQETSQFTNEGFFYLWRHSIVFSLTNSFDLFKN